MERVSTKTAVNIITGLLVLIGLAFAFKAQLDLKFRLQKLQKPSATVLPFPQVVTLEPEVAKRFQISFPKEASSTRISQYQLPADLRNFVTASRGKINEVLAVTFTDRRSGYRVEMRGVLMSTSHMGLMNYVRKQSKADKRWSHFQAFKTERSGMLEGFTPAYEVQFKQQETGKLSVRMTFLAISRNGEKSK